MKSTSHPEPHHLLKTFSCDEIAECWDVPDVTYLMLWRVLTQRGTPLKELIDIENSAPQDALGFNTPACFWDAFTLEEKLELNQVAERAANG